MDKKKSNEYVAAALDAGAKHVESRINFMWALCFPSMEAAQTFAARLSADSVQDVRGPHDFGDEQRGFAVGWRIS